MSTESSGIFYRLTFDDGVEPDGFEADLVARIQAHPERNRATRIGSFEGMRILSEGHTSPVGDSGTFQERTQYLFLVAGGMRPLPWLVELLGTYGTVSFPLGEDAIWHLADADDRSSTAG
jgi:hypothetical protein